MKDVSIELPGRVIGLPMLQLVSRVQSQHAVRNIWHSHLGFELIFLLKGATGYEFEDHDTVQLHGGHFLVIPARVIHRGLHGVRGPCTLCGLAFGTSQLTGWKNTALTLADVRRLLTTLQTASYQVHPIDASLRWVVRRLRSEIQVFAHRKSPERNAANLRALISLLLGEVIRQVRIPLSPPKELVAAAMAYLQGHLSEPVYMPDLVRRLGYGRTRFFEMFKAETGQTPNEYLLRLRITKAMELLEHSRLTGLEIALETGFGSAQNFSAMFRRYTGVSPSSYRTGSFDHKQKMKNRRIGQ